MALPNKKKTIVNGAVRANVGTIDQVETNGVNNISGEELNALSGASGNIQEQLSALSENLSDLGKNGGGLSYKRKLTANDHLNDVLEDGLYDLAAGDIPSDIPDGYANMNGMLVVETAQAVSTTIQTLYMFNNGIHDVWSRRHWPSGWSDWTKWAMETNASAQAMLKKTPVSADDITDEDGIFGSHNGNFVTRSMGKLWKWIVYHISVGIDNSVNIATINGVIPQIKMKNTLCTKDSYTLLMKNHSNSVEDGTHLRDVSNGKITDLRLLNGSATIGGSEILRKGNLFSVVPDLVTRGNTMCLISAGAYSCYPNEEYAYDGTDWGWINRASNFLIVGVGSSVNNNGDLGAEDYFLVQAVFFKTYASSNVYSGTYQKVTLGSSGSTARFSVVVSPDGESTNVGAFVRVPKGSSAYWEVYKI